MKELFENRRDAGRHLASALVKYAGRQDLLVLALPRGGVPVGYEIARSLPAPLDVFVVRKLGVPGREELAMGAIASGGVTVINPTVVERLRIPPERIDAVIRDEREELARREALYRDARPAPEIAGRVVILVDDGLATGATMRAGVTALGQLAPAHLVLAVPVAAEETVAEFRADGIDIVCLASPEPFRAVGMWYRDFSQTSDDEVRELLRENGAEMVRPSR